MGFISGLRAKGTASGQVNAGRAVWRAVFGTDKERGTGLPPPPVPRPDGGWGRSASERNAAAYLLRALRSRAPGTRTDDRYEQSRHFTSLPYVAIHRKAEQLAQAEFQVFKKDDRLPEGKRPISQDDPPEGGRLCRPYDLVKLLSNPNPGDTFGSMMYRWSQQMDLTGSALTWMVPNDLPEELQYPMELYPIETALALERPPVDPEYPDGFWQIQPIYPYGPFTSYPTPLSAVGARIPTKWMMRAMYPHPYIRYDAWSPLTALKLHIDEVEMMDRSRHYSMRRSINPSAVLNFENMEGAQPLPDEEIDRIRAEFEEQQQGPENAGTLFVASPGSRLEPWGSKPIEMDYTNSWNQLTGFCLAGFGITKQAAGMIEDSSYSTLFATMKQFYWQTLDPQVQRFAGELTKRLAGFFGDDLIVEIRCRRIDDHDVLLSKLNAALNARAITKNEFRHYLEMPLTAAPWGDEIAGVDPMAEVQMGMADPSALRPGSPPTVPQPDMGGADPQAAMQEAMRLLPAEISASRPDPGNLGQGAMGQRKEAKLPARVRMTKSLYERVREVMANGH